MLVSGQGPLVQNARVYPLVLLALAEEEGAGLGPFLPLSREAVVRWGARVHGVFGGF